MSNASAAQSSEITISFVNRYLEPMDDIKYKIIFEGNQTEGVTTVTDYMVKVHSDSDYPIRVYVWSRRNKAFKLIDRIIPISGKSQLVYEHMRSFKHQSKTYPHPQHPPSTPPAPVKPPVKPAPGPSPTNDQGVNQEQKNNEHDEPVHYADRPLPDKITLQQMKKIYPYVADSYLQQVADELNADLKKYGLDTPLRRAHFFAQVMEEGGEMLVAGEENLNYKSSVLIEKFKYYKNHLDSVVTR